MNRNYERKIRYVQITGDILQREGMDGVSIRRIADQAHCTSAVLYKHFNNKEHLIMLASVRFLEPYINAFIELNARQDLSSLQMDLMLWRLFIVEAFNNMPYYKLLFFEAPKEALEDCVYEYFQMFPDTRQQFTGLTASIVFSGDLADRELIRLRRAANEGEITLENARLLSKLTVAVFDGVFMQHARPGADNTDADQAADQCYEMIEVLFRQFAKTGVKLNLDQ